MAPQTIALEEAQPGDLIFCHSSGAVGRAIRLAERLRWRDGARYNHVAWLNRYGGIRSAGLKDDPRDWLVGQAEAHGVTVNQPLSTVAGSGDHVIVRLPADCDREKALKFLRAQVGARYGFLSIASIVITLLLPRFINVMLPNTWICSAVAAEGLRFGGWLHNWPDLYQASPAQLWEALDR